MALNDFQEERAQGPGNLRVLIIEDNPSDVILIVSLLKQAGYSVEHDTVHRRDELRQKLGEGSYDVILADHNLINWDGFSALEIYRETGCDAPFIVVTASLGDEAAAEYIKQGASDYVLKTRLQRLPLVIERSLRQKFLEEQLRQAQKMEAVGRLAGGVAHDFNNLLTVILGRCGFLAECLPSGSLSHRYVDEIRQAGEQAASLTQQLLSFSRNQLIAREVVDMNEVISKTNTTLQRLIGEDIELVTRLEPGLGSVKVNPSQMEQVLLNLAANARDAMPQGGKMTIETKNVVLPDATSIYPMDAPPGPYILLTVTDTGCGMDTDTLKHIFEPFYTTKEKAKGTGIGLSTVYGIVKQSHGSIFVQTKPNSGTTFRIYLPKSDETAPATASREPAGGSTGETVLLVEDDVTVRNLTAEVLEYKGYRVLCAGSAKEALRLSEQYLGTIHLLLTDVVMPVQSGPALGQALLRERPEIQVLYMSGYTESMISQHGIPDKSAHLISKPFTMDALAAKVREVLAGFNPQRRNGTREV
jgi:two-component system, cell cycle sensor histidine kinase and response regulator CckA